MADLATPLPTRRPDLVILPLGENGPYVVKDPGSASYYQLGAEEHFLLLQLDGRSDAPAACAAFAQRFGQPLTEDELNEFLDVAQAQGFLLPLGAERQSPEDRKEMHQATDAPRPPKERQSILYWRKSFWNPDRFFTWLEPKIRFFWTRGFLVVSAGCILLAVLVLGIHAQQAAGNFREALRWETAVWVWLTLFAVTMLHESAHGLTCKHYGGEVREIGFLLMYFMPCFYCNVSDAWLFKEKSKRLWVTFAGGYFELFLWSLAVFVWRLTVPGSLVNYLAYIVVSVCGVQTLFNFNPLLKLDGYYLLSDWLEIPNLQQRAEGGLKARLRWLLWGADRPSWEPRSRALLCYGVAALVYSWVFLAAMLLAFGQFLWSRFGWPGVAAILVLTTLSLRNLFRGISGGEVTKMFRYRLTRVVAWALALSVAATALSFIEVEDRATGTFRVRPVTRAEVRAAVAGFLRAAYRDEGDRVAAGDLLVTLEVPDLASRLAQKRAEVSEAAARLRLLQAGTRPETLTEQRCRVQRARDWRDLGDQDLKRGRKSLEEELFCLDKQIALCHAELDAAKDAYKRCQELLTRSAISPEECRAAETRQTVCQARLEQAQAQHRARTAKGLHEAEAELARRTNELAEAQAALALLEAGARSEEIEAETSHLARLQEEARFLEQLEGKLVVSSPVGGLVTTSRLREKVGQFVHEGDLICVVEEPGRLDVEITLTEQEAVRVRPGQAVILKARALPFETITARVERVAPTVAAGDGQGQMTVYSALDGSPEELRPGMTGHARVGTGRGSLPAIGLDRVSRYVRTEFWW